ncbi:MAG: ribonuclease III [Acutalibacteraceae bacterium]
MTELEQFCKTLEYDFKNIEYLKTALTHSSYANERKDGVVCNERQEFLGDSVLSIIVSDYIFKNCPDLPEGELTKLRASLVCEKTLAVYARSINLGKYLLLSRGESKNGGRNRPSILADAFESVIAAIYLDGGMECARKFVLRFVVDDIKNHRTHNFVDYKTKLQEIVQKNPEEKISYVLTGESGPDHDKHFTVEVHLNSNVVGKGGGRSKKEAEQQAAREALELMGY